MRDRLIELLQKRSWFYNKCKCNARCSNCDYVTIDDNDIGKLADHLLANGVVVPTFNTGDKVWFVPKGLKEVCEATVVRIEYNYFTNPQEWLVIDYFSSIVGKQEYKSRIDLILNKTVFLTKEEAERAFKGGERDGKVY